VSGYATGPGLCPVFEFLGGIRRGGQLVVVERGWVRTTDTRVSFHKRLAGTPGGVDRYTLIRENSSGEGFTILASCPTRVVEIWYQPIRGAGVMGLSGLEIRALPSLQQKWGGLGTHSSYRRSMELVKSGCGGGGLLSFLALIKNHCKN